MKNAIVSGVLGLFAVPTLVAGASIGSSLIAGLSPDEAVTVLADQLGLLNTRVEQVESTQNATATTTLELQQEISALNASNETLRANNAVLGSRVSTLETTPPPSPATTTIVQIVEVPVVVAPEPEVVPADTEAPRVNLAPLASEWSSSKFFKDGVYGTAGIEEWEYMRDNIKVDKVLWKIDGINHDGPRAPYFGAPKFAFDTTKLLNGEHTLTLVASDAAGNMSEDSITITVKN